MHITVKTLLGHSTFKDVAVLAGADGLSRKINRVSVYDSAVKEYLIDSKFLLPGDFYLSTLDIFRSEPHCIVDFFMLLDRSQASGLMITDENVGIIPQQALEYCNLHHFPLLFMEQDIAYADIINLINGFITVENTHALNSLKLEKIADGRTPGHEKQQLLSSMSPNIRQFIKVVIINGNLESDAQEGALNFYFMRREHDLYVRMKMRHVFVFSKDEEKALEQTVLSHLSYLRDYFPGANIGISQCYFRRFFDKAFKEARLALTTAISTGQERLDYNPMCSVFFLTLLKDSKEMNEYYQKYLSLIHEYDSDGNAQLLDTVREYVASGGDFNAAAEKLHQHPNTIRYRINKVKTILGLEDDTIKFNETISLITTIEKILD